jgi:hypothetical protein
MPQIGTSTLDNHQDYPYFEASGPRNCIRYPIKDSVSKDLKDGEGFNLDITFMRYNRAVLSQSLPLTSFGTMKSVANFSVSVEAAINAFKHFLTGSRKFKMEFKRNFY